MKEERDYFSISITELENLTIENPSLKVILGFRYKKGYLFFKNKKRISFHKKKRIGTKIDYELERKHTRSSANEKNKAAIAIELFFFNFFFFFKFFFIHLFIYIYICF